MRNIVIILFAAAIVMSLVSAVGNEGVAAEAEVHTMAISASNGIAVTADEAAEQERIDTIVRAFNRLPAPELSRLGVDVSEHIVQGTTKAEILKRTWLERQKELREAMDSMTKPVEHMGQLAQQIKSFTEAPKEKENLSNIHDISNVLEELETSLADIDNARDFHTIGGWPILVNMLEPGRHPALRSRAAMAIGTAMKNSYDYQLWALESSSVPIGNWLGQQIDGNWTCLELLLDLLDSSDVSDLEEEPQRRALYALSSAMRGNSDVQEALLSMTTTDIEPRRNSKISYDILKQLTVLASKNSTSPEVPRKVWSLVADMLGESGYVHGELAAVLANHPDKIAMREQLHSLKMLGDSLCSVQWAFLASAALRRFGTQVPASMSQRSTLVSVLQTVDLIFQQCPDKFAASADLISILSEQVHKLHGHYSQTHSEEANRGILAPQPDAAEPKISDPNDEEIAQEEFDLNDPLDDVLVTTFAEEVVTLATRISLSLTTGRGQ